MRKLALLPLALLPLLACTAILGDFSVGTVALDGGGDGSPSDVVSNPDAPLSDGGGDGDADAAPPLKLLNCTLDVNRVSFVFDDAGTTQTNNGDHPTIYPLASNQYRLLLSGYNGFYYTDFFDNDSSRTFQRFNYGQNAAFISSTRYTGGTIFMVYENGGLSVVKFPDGASTPVAGLQLVNQGSFSPLWNNQYHIVGTLDVVNAATDDYMFAIEYTTDGTNYEIAFGHATGSPTSLTTVTTLTAPQDIPQYALVHDANHAYLFTAPPGSNGPPTGPGVIYSFLPSTPSSFTSHQVSLGNDDAGFYMPFAMTESIQPPFVDLATFSADLGQQTVLPVLTAARLQASDLTTFAAAAWPTVSIQPSLIPVNKGNMHWQQFSGEDEFVAVSRPINDGVPGMNLVWLDSLGRARVLLSTDGGANFPSTLINAADLTFVSQPAVAYAQFEIAWVEGQGNNLSAPPTYAAKGTCTSF
ncbi:MAG TPA: hypothetical protein VLM85_12575 [Polyangiaceae bacterium]|nr:hypothetical protein [Polyangiaceae bacterium]